MGNFNVDFATDISFATDLQLSFNIFQYITQPTHVIDHSSIIIDYIYSTHHKLINSAGVFNLSIPDSNATYCRVNSVVNVQHSACLNGKFLSFKSMNLNVAKLKADLDFIPWCSIESTDDLNDKLAMFNLLFMDI